jgi:hypothetical protein
MGIDFSGLFWFGLILGMLIAGVVALFVWLGDVLALPTLTVSVPLGWLLAGAVVGTLALWMWSHMR